MCAVDYSAKPISIVICGLVRDAERLADKLRNYVDWRAQGRVDQIVDFLGREKPQHLKEL